MLGKKSQSTITARDLDLLTMAMARTIAGIWPDAFYLALPEADRDRLRVALQSKAPTIEYR